MQRSELAGGPGGVGTLQNPGQETKQFGELPEKLRERILQARERGFPPGYEKVLKSYYTRLAEQAAGTKKPPEDAPKPPDEGR